MKPTRFYLFRILVFTGLVFAGLPVWAQLYSGSVTGVVTDPSGAVVPGAAITVTDVAKGYTFHATTDANGRYLVRSLQPGDFRITAEMTGLQTEVRTGINIAVNQNLAVDLTMQVATTATSVDVKTQAVELATSDAVTGQVLDRKLINDLPNVNRDVMDFSYLTPGIVSSFNGSHGGGNNFISNGSRNATADVLMDGVTLTNSEQNSATQVLSYQPSPDAVQEFKVQTSNFSAEFGFTGSTIVNMVTRSGTNEFHGVGYEFLRNQKLDANNFFANAAGQPLPGLKRNNFGGTIGGPIIKNKTFFFFDYDGTRDISQQSNSGSVPSMLERQGNFGELCGVAGGTFDSAGRCSAAGGQLWDPYTGSYDPNAGGAVRTGYIPFNNLSTYVSPGNPNLSGTGYQLAPTKGNLIDPVAQKMMSYYPAPNLNVGTSAYNPYLNWFATGANRSNNDQLDIKIDHSFSEKSLLSVKYSQALGSTVQWNCYGNVADPCSTGPNDGANHAVALNWNYTLKPTMLFSLSYGWNRTAGHVLGAIANNKGFDPIKELGEPSYMYRSGINAFPWIGIGDNYSGPGLGTQPWAYQVYGNDTHQLLGTFSWVKGLHELKFGAEVRMHRINYVNPGPTGGNFNFDYTGSSQDPQYGDGGDAYASFLMGVGTGNNGTYEVANWVSTQNFAYAGFVNDSWKITKKLTLNFGLRYDLTMPRTERYNRMNYVDPNVASPLQVPGVGTLHGGEIFNNPHDRYNYDPSFTNFQPRFGFAWQALDKTVVRGGYGIFYSVSRAAAAGPGAWGYQGYVEDTPWITSYNNDGATPWGRLSDPYPGVGPKLPPGSSLGLLNDIGYSAIGPIKSINAVPYVQSWSLGFQRELPWNIVLDANYVGNKATHNYFGGAGELNHLSAAVEKYTPAQIAQLFTYVNNPFSRVVTDPNTFLSSPQVQALQLQLPFPQFSGFGEDSPPYSNSNYNSAQLKVEKRFSNGLEFLVTYTFSKAIDDASAFDGNNTFLGMANTSLQDPNNRRLERSVSVYDMTHVLQITHVYELPFGRGKAIGANWNPVFNAIAGGWQLNGIWTISSGFPLAMGLNACGSYNLPTYGCQRPNLTATPERNTGSDWMTQYFANPDVFTTPAHYTLGNAPRVLPWLRMPGQRNATLSVMKSFPLTKVREGMRLEFRAEALNAFNHPQFNAPNTTVGSGTFGQITSQANLPRQAQMALKLYF